VKATSTTATSEPTTSAATPAVAGPASVTELLGLSAGPGASEGVIAATGQLMTFIAVAAHRIVPWIERWLLIEGVAPSRRGIERVPAKLSRPIHLRIPVL
jgi:small neutral amino acid transporter SnatA (MarC family)